MLLERVVRPAHNTWGAKVYSNFRPMKSQSQGVQERRGACQLNPCVKRGACRTRHWDVLQDGLKPPRALDMARAYDMVVLRCVRHPLYECQLCVVTAVRPVLARPLGR